MSAQIVYIPIFLLELFWRKATANSRSFFSSMRDRVSMLLDLSKNKMVESGWKYRFCQMKHPPDFNYLIVPDINCVCWEYRVVHSYWFIRKDSI